ncbi:prolyl aminopeptidase [Rhizobium rhizogenes]|uniref:Proline iminopeptidase n=1 Tax=Rhizobium rhizogenes TaxID=359 RepID=A0AA92BZ18_RHIRH|nr:prolyl aminopeptidase [Rhizobium rhizogenes]PVE49892.1 prolyl aminopeptidase [Rhizobium rhizogenes]PVE62015.1 prolyl aminopeptidase [Agrobacterium tumefaciens]PVE69779.1 prolyl aminopeptidase [Sphingomonas sp. TPD3009]
MLYPPSEPFTSGLLKVDGKNEIYWEVSGNPDGKPALYLHGGPGSGLRSGSYRQLFNPEKYYLVGIDQRGCGRSRPLATVNLGDLPSNNTQALIADIEAVRSHLKIASWLVSGVSWGVTLSLAYAQRHPERISELVLMAVTTTSRSEVDWITEGIGCLFPQEWESFAQSSNRGSHERIVEAYARRLASSDAVDRSKAAEAWIKWESTHISLDPNWVPMSERFDDERAAVFATLVTHYWSNDGFLLDGTAVIDRLPMIKDIPAVMIHGRRDFSGPLMTAWKLHRAWPTSRLVIVEEEGHGGPMSKEHMRAALDGFCV